MKKVVLTAAALLFILSVSLAQKRNIDLDKIITEMKLNVKGKFPYGFKPGTSRQSIEKAMKAHADVYSQDSGFVTYSVYLSDDDIDFGDITFDFADRVKLKSASIATYLGSWDISNKSFNAIKNNFDKLYGPSTFEEDTFYWKYKKKGKTLEIQMFEIDQEDDNGYGIDFLYY